MQSKLPLRSLLTLSLFFLLGLGVSVGSYVALKRIDSDNFHSKLANEASERISAVKRSFEVNQLAIEASQSFFSSTNNIDHLKFKKFISPLFSKLPGIKAMEWVPRINYSEIDKHLSKMQDEGFLDFRLTEKNEYGELVDIRNRPEYYPVYYLEPYLGNEKVHGFDLASNPTRFKALSMARDTGRSIATERINLIQAKQNNYGFLIFSPVYNKLMPETSSASDRQHSITGFALGVFKFNEIIEAAINIFESNEIYLQLLDISDLKNNQLLFSNVPENTIENYGLDQELNESVKDFLYSKDVDFLGRVWRINCIASASFKDQNKSYLALFVMFLGLILTCFITYAFYKHMYGEQKTDQLVKKQTSKLLELSERLKFAIEGAQLGLWDWNIKTGDLYWSKRIAPLFGYTEGTLETSYDNFVEAIHKDDRQSVLSAIDNCIENGEAYNIEHRVVWPDGEIRWVQETGDVVRDTNGTALKMIGVVQDIHHRKVIELTLRESEEKYRRLFELSEDPMWLIIGNQFVLANKAAAHILGYKSEEELTHTHPSLLSPEFQPDERLSVTKSNEMIAIAYRNGYHRFEWLHKKKNGRTFPVEVTLTSIPYEGNDALFCVWRDITESKMQQKRLKAAKDDAEKANQAKSVFLSSMSHELRTPMNAVLGFSELLATDTQSPLTEDQLECVEHIIDGGQHLLRLIDDVLDLAKIESGHSDLNVETIDINALILQVLLLIRPQAEQHEITLENKVTADYSFKIQADQKKLKQVLLNLCSNAIKFNSQNGILTISCVKTHEHKIRLSVSDTGKGAPEELFPSLFEPFNRLDKANSNIQGTGIGLNICKQLVKQMNGEIGVFNNSDKGLTFWVEFDEAPCQ